MKSGAGCGVIRPYGYRAVRRVSAESRESSAPRSRRNGVARFRTLYGRGLPISSRAPADIIAVLPAPRVYTYILVSLGVTMCAPGAYFLARVRLPFAYLYTHRATAYKFDRLASLDPSNVSHFPTPPRAPAAHALPAVLRLSVCSHVHIAPLSAPARALSSHVHL